jgi:hypothetical protein
MTAIPATELEPLSRKQVFAARKALGSRVQYGQVQARKSDVDGVAHVEAFSPAGKTCKTVTIGPRGGVWSIDTNLVQ